MLCARDGDRRERCPWCVGTMETLVGAVQRSARSKCVLARRGAPYLCCECRAVPARRARGHSEMRGCNRVPLHAPRAAGHQRGNRPRARPVCVSARSGVSASSATRGHIQPTDSTMGSAPGALHDVRPARDGAIRPATDAPTSHPVSFCATRKNRRALNPLLEFEANFVPGRAPTPSSWPRPRRAFVRARPAAECSR